MFQIGSIFLFTDTLNALLNVETCPYTVMKTPKRQCVNAMHTHLDRILYIYILINQGPITALTSVTIVTYDSHWVKTLPEKVNRKRAENPSYHEYDASKCLYFACIMVDNNWFYLPCQNDLWPQDVQLSTMFGFQTNNGSYNISF